MADFVTYLHAESFLTSKPVKEHAFEHPRLRRAHITALAAVENGR